MTGLLAWEHKAHVKAGIPRPSCELCKAEEAKKPAWLKSLKPRDMTGVRA
jgi:hypothetical protein